MAVSLCLMIDLRSWKTESRLLFFHYSSSISPSVTWNGHPCVDQYVSLSVCEVEEGILWGQIQKHKHYAYAVLLRCYGICELSLRHKKTLLCANGRRFRSDVRLDSFSANSHAGSPAAEKQSSLDVVCRDLWWPLYIKPHDTSSGRGGCKSNLE